MNEFNNGWMAGYDKGYKAGRAYQREVDAEILNNIATEIARHGYEAFSNRIYQIAKAIREQEMKVSDD